MREAIEDTRPDIQAVYEHYGLRIIGADRGLWRKAECPLSSHDDKNPSASVNTDENKWVCHACDEHGDSYDIIKEREGVTRWSDIERIAASFAHGGSTPVREPRGGSSLLPRGQGHRPGRGAFTPPWTRL